MVKWEKIDGSKVALEVEVAEPQVSQALELAYKQVVKKVNVPGFRKGKAPRPVLESRFGPEILYEDTLEILVPRAYRNAVTESGIEPIDEPEIDIMQIEKGMPLIFKATVEVKPEVTLGEYRGVEVTRNVNEVSDEDVDEKLEQMRRQHAKLHVVDDGAVAEGDLVVIDFDGFVDNEPFEGGHAEGFSLEIGSGSLISGFEDQLIDMKVGDEWEIDVVFPEDYGVEQLAGKPAVFEVKLNEIKRKEFPEINDDFAVEVSEFATLAELKKDIRNKLKEALEKKERAELENLVIEKVADLSEVPLPDVLINREIDRMINEMTQYLTMQGLTIEKFLAMTGKSMDELREQYLDEAGIRVKANLVLDAIIQKEGIEPTDAEIEDKIRKFAEGYKQDYEKVRGLFDQQGQTGVISAEIKYRKAIDFLVAEAKVTAVDASAAHAGNQGEE
jgi:trigger factor